MPAVRRTTALPRPALRRSPRLQQRRSEKLNQTLQSTAPARKSNKRSAEAVSHPDQRKARPKRIKIVFAAEEEVGTSSQDNALFSMFFQVHSLLYFLRLILNLETLLLFLHNTEDSDAAEALVAKISPREISLNVEQESEPEDLQSLLLFPWRVYRSSPLAIAVIAIDEELVPCTAAWPPSCGVNACRVAPGLDKSRNGTPDRQPRLLAQLQQKLIWTEMAEIQRQWELEQAAALDALAAEIEAELFGDMDID
ncbi:hypothetical protein BJ741DRAFT_694914 [Chytriomyces cf. hyalinus JEL632]|nr:hypothetical protein BJ741DRAFT_694914 [Chytriomyces cf. hyalinus JEL632]